MAYRNTFALGNRTPGLSRVAVYIMSPLSTQQSFPLQAKRIYRDSSFVTVMSFGDKLSLPTRCFFRCFGSHGRTVACGYFCNRLRTAKPYVTLLASNHDRSNPDLRIMSENPGVTVYVAMKSAVTFVHSTPIRRLETFLLRCKRTYREA